MHEVHVTMSSASVGGIQELCNSLEAKVILIELDQLPDQLMCGKRVPYSTQKAHEWAEYFCERARAINIRPIRIKIGGAFNLAPASLTDKQYWEFFYTLSTPYIGVAQYLGLDPFKSLEEAMPPA